MNKLSKIVKAMIDVMSLLLLIGVYITSIILISMMAYQAIHHNDISTSLLTSTITITLFALTLGFSYAYLLATNES